MSIAALLRRWRHPEYRRAHRDDLPTIRDWIIAVLIMLAMSFAGFTVDTARLRTQALEAIGAAERVLNCLNGKTTLGGEYLAPDGSTWVTLCSTYERRIKP